MDYDYIKKRENNCWQAKDKNGRTVSIDDVHHGSYAYCQCTCLAYKDLKDFKSSNIKDIDGQQVYRGKRGKTGIEFTIPLLPKALEILDKYDRQLPVISNVKYNKYVKEVAEAAELKKKLTTHWARHTGATMLLNAGVPMQVVSKVCGHQSLRLLRKLKVN